MSEEAPHTPPTIERRLEFGDDDDVIEVEPNSIIQSGMSIIITCDEQTEGGMWICLMVARTRSPTRSALGRHMSRLRLLAHTSLGAKPLLALVACFALRQLSLPAL